jgi:single-strand DNA-binding protein
MSKMFVLGRLGRDAETRYTQSGDAVVGLAVAYNFGRKGEDGKRPSQWLDCSFWGKRAEAVAPYLTKGAQVAVTLDEVHIETYEGRNGQGHKLVGRVMDLELAGSRDSQQQSQSQPPAQPRQQQRPAPQQRTPAPAGGASSGFEDMDDDIPFVSCAFGHDTLTSKRKRMGSYDY